MTQLDGYFKAMLERRAADLHLASGSPPLLRIDGELLRLEAPELETESLRQWLNEIAPAYKLKILEENGEVDFGYESSLGCRFRVNYYRHVRGIGAVFRRIPAQVPTFEDFDTAGAPMPAVLKKFTLLHRGLLLVTGPTGSGKSTTQAVMVDYANKHRRDHLVTLEDPIEFIHPSRSSLVTQREVGAHTRTFAGALRATLREDPNIILVGEMRDLETIELALLAANTGHLVLGTLHTQSAAKTIDRIIDVFPPEQQSQIRMTLAETLRGVVAQELFRRIDHKGRIAAFEILVFNAAMANLVREGKTHQIPGMMQVGRKLGNQLMDDAILELLKLRRISAEEAYEKCVDRKKFRPFLAHPPDEDDL